MQDVDDRYASDNKQPKKSFRFTVWGVLATLMGLALLGGAYWMYAQIRSVNERHHSSSPFPWKGEHISVSSVEAHWKSSEGDERMRMRVAYFPSARISLGNSVGKGTVTVTFRDEFNRQVGEAIHIPYADGKFGRRNENWVQTEDSVATCRVAAGFENEGELKLHRLMEETPLWSVKVIYRAEGESGAHYLGTVTVSPEEEPVAETSPSEQ